MRTAKAQVRLCIRVVTPEPLRIYSIEQEKGYTKNKTSNSTRWLSMQCEFEERLYGERKACNAHLKNDFTENEKHAMRIWRMTLRRTKSMQCAFEEWLYGERKACNAHLKNDFTENEKHAMRI